MNSKDKNILEIVNPEQYATTWFHFLEDKSVLHRVKKIIELIVKGKIEIN